MGGDCGFNRGLLPLVIGAFYEDHRTKKAKTDEDNPKEFSSTRLRERFIKKAENGEMLVFFLPFSPTNTLNRYLSK